MSKPKNERSAPNSSCERPSDRSARVADSFGRFSGIRVSYGPQNELIAALDETRMTALKIREQRRLTGRPLPMPVMRTIAEMGVGKTWAAEKLEELHRPTDPADRRKPVLIAPLDTSGSQASVPSAILVALGVRAPEHGKPPILWRRAHSALLDHSVEIVIFDEINRAARRPSIGPIIGGDLMQFLVDGDVAVAFLGTADADKLFSRAPALRDRLKSPVVMKALDWEVQAEDGTYPERELFLEFLDNMDRAMAQCGLIERLAGLATDATGKLLWEVCRGRLRPLCLLLEEAVGIVHRAGGELIIDHGVLAEAVENHSIPNEVITYNPFTGEIPG